ncbi:ZIP family metal transporter [Thermaurantimonas aggregans]|uniref:ZIP family metal transporter n=1 Tax=Thermaurantimonas aggregans TaxID=2173829 RepID=UPI000F55AE30|nr:ZIP family metal transporter [Thermaurantimonas aggregans]MCX8148801.1 ZIP family metal transporter [Thermaurantimonas aggregans]
MIVNLLTLFFSTFSGAWLARWFTSRNHPGLKILLAFSGSFILAITALHILPDIYDRSGHNHIVGLFIMLGILLQIVLEFFTQGIEHGHHHHHDNVLSLSKGAVVGLYLHSILESLPLGVQWILDEGNLLFWGVVFHHLPIGIILYMILKSKGLKRNKILFYLALFAMSSPAGALAGYFIPAFQKIFVYLLAIVAGIFMHISTTIIFESSHDHRFNMMKLVTIVLASSLAFGMVEFLH